MVAHPTLVTGHDVDSDQRDTDEMQQRDGEASVRLVFQVGAEGALGAMRRARNAFKMTTTSISY